MEELTPTSTSMASTGLAEDCIATAMQPTAKSATI